MQISCLQGAQIVAVAANAEGRITFHNVTSYLSLSAKLVGRLVANSGTAPVLVTNGKQLGPISQLVYLPVAKLEALVKSAPRAQKLEVRQALEGHILICSGRGAFVGELKSLRHYLDSDRIGYSPLSEHIS